MIKTIPVLSLEQVASISKEEIISISRRWTAARLYAFPDAPPDLKPSFFVTTKSGMIDVKFPPKVEIEIIGPSSVSRGRL